MAVWHGPEAVWHNSTEIVSRRNSYEQEFRHKGIKVEKYHALAMALASFSPASAHDAMAMLGECGPREVELTLAAAAEHRANALIVCLDVLTDWKRRGRDLGLWGLTMYEAP